MTSQDLLNIKDNQILNITEKVGKLGSSVRFQVMKNINRFTEEITFVVVTREGFLKFFGNALVAAYEGQEGLEKKTFKTADAAAMFLKSK